ncbi:MAG: SpoIIE family protein phosphatase, partial [Deltaproteobacteria bacterium]|nr:SpoIIE family protein phosphatase [Deltaproteobacteria bacterium]
AERGLLFLKSEDGSSDLEMGRGSEGADLPEVSSYSTTIIRRVRETKKPIVVTGTAEGEVLGSASIAAHGLRSIIAAPVMMGTRVLGVIYLDSRLAKGIFTENHLDLLVAIGFQIGIAFETSRSARIEVEKADLEKDLALTGAMQQFFLPRVNSFSRQGVQVESYYQPAQHCGGDWWWVEPSEDAGTNVILGDVTGHGAASAMMTAAVSSRYETVLGEPAARLKSLSDLLASRTNGRYMMTMTFLRFDPGAAKFAWWSAAAPPLLLRRASGKTDLVTTVGTPLGSAEYTFGFKEEPFLAKERMFIFTDGLSELNVGGGKQLGMRRLKKIFDETCALPLAAARDEIGKRLDAERGKTPLADDVTFVLVERD